MKHWFALVCLPFFLAASPVPIIAGAARDQFGDPVAGARVSAGGRTTTTDADGTFSIESGARVVRIECAFCRTVEAAVAPDGTVAALVVRYRAVQEDKLSPEDIRTLPYSRAESLLSVQPYIVLLDSERALPGPRVSANGASRFGGVLLDSGVASYDIAAGVTPFRTLPAFSAISAQAAPLSGARYGDLSAGGILQVDSIAPGEASSNILAGTQHSARVSAANQNSAFAVNWSGDTTDRASRADAAARIAAGSGSILVNAFSAGDAFDAGEYGSSQSNFSAVHARYSSASLWYADASADRAGYLAQTGGTRGIAGLWSDTSFTAGLQTRGSVSFFADAGSRFSSGSYGFGDSLYAYAPVAGAVSQQHVDTGVRGATNAMTWTLEAGAFDVQTKGGNGGAPSAQRAQILAPAAQLAFALSPQWRARLAASQTFRLPVLTELYTFGAPGAQLPYDRIGLQHAELEYTDLRRLRAGAMLNSAGYANLDRGNVISRGVFAAWQFSDALSVRAWAMSFDDTTHAAVTVYRYAGYPRPAAVHSLWLSYRAPSGLNADVIWRRDLLDYVPFAHIDASLSAPLASNVRWFAGSESHQGRRFFSAGLRFGP